MTLPALLNETLEYQNGFETKLTAPLSSSDTLIYIDELPTATASIVVIDPYGEAPEYIFYNAIGADYIETPSAINGEGRGVGASTPGDYVAGTTVGIYSIAEFFEAIVTGRAMHTGFLQSRHFGTDLDPNNWLGTGENWVFQEQEENNVGVYVVTGNKTEKYSLGTKLRMPRATSYGYQCADFERSSSHYATKASPTSLGITSDFTIEATINVESYPSTGNNATIFSQSNGTTGIGLGINEYGQLYIFGAGASSVVFTTKQSIPRGERISVTGKLHMHASAPTASLYINGVSVDAVLSGTPTATVTLAGPIQIGAENSAKFFDGKISDVRVWSDLRSDSEVIANMNKRLVGDEANLVGYWPLNGNFEDLSTTNNDLTPTNGVLATDTNVTYATEYGKVIGIVYGGGNTTIRVFTGTKHTAPDENLTNVAYSNGNTPVGFPTEPIYWRIAARYRVAISAAFVSTNTWETPVPVKVRTPAGTWNMGYDLNIEQINGSTGITALQVRANASGGLTNGEDSYFRFHNAAAVTSASATAQKNWFETVSAATTIYLQQLTEGGAGTISGSSRSDLMEGVVYAQCPY